MARLPNVNLQETPMAGQSPMFGSDRVVSMEMKLNRNLNRLNRVLTIKAVEAREMKLA
jgi:hypothetical protein